MLKSQVLRSAEFLIEFLNEPSIDKFMLKAMGSQMEQGPRKLTDFKTLNGEIEITSRKSAKQFADNLDKFVDTYSEINN